MVEIAGMSLGAHAEGSAPFASAVQHWERVQGYLQMTDSTAGTGRHGFVSGCSRGGFLLR